MCGLFLVLERARPIALERARKATEALRHRGPDGIGQSAFSWTLPADDGAVSVSGYMGHTRLAILDPQARSDQPFRRGGHTLVYNGEIYNFRALRAELARSGARFDTDGDTEVLLSLLVHAGVDGLNRANGMWGLCLLDQARGTITAIRDRYGKKPLFWYQDAQRLCLASEIAPIQTYLAQSPRFMAGDLDNYLQGGWCYPHADGATHLQNIHQVAAGTALEFDLANWRRSTSTWYDLAGHVASDDKDPQQLDALLQDAVSARLVADRRVGLLLSGGVDSSLILSILAHRGLTEQVTCFTGDAGKSEDARYAAACIEQLGIRSVNLPLEYGGAGMDSFLQVCRHQEKPFPFIGNALAMPQLYAHIAEHDVPVVLDGTGGDEIFAGYWDRYFRFAVAQALAAGDTHWCTQIAQANADEPRMRAIVDQAFAWCAQDGTATSATAHVRRESDDPADMDQFVHASVRAAPGCDPLIHFRGDLTEALVRDAGAGRLHEWLWQNDRNAMMSGIENRSPLLDYRLAPYMASGYARKFVGPWNKHELRTRFPVALPTQWRRDKQGFRWVYHRFLRHNQDQVLQLIAASTILPERVDVGRLLDAARRDPHYLACSLLHRCLCIAGLEQTCDIQGIADTPTAPA
jgi:asparagine synthase (glutamine-hydrolysing)